MDFTNINLNHIHVKQFYQEAHRPQHSSEKHFLRINNLERIYDYISIIYIIYIYYITLNKAYDHISRLIKVTITVQ